MEYKDSYLTITMTKFQRHGECSDKIPSSKRENLPIEYYYVPSDESIEELEGKIQR